MRRSSMIMLAGLPCAYTFLFNSASLAGELDCGAPTVGPDIVAADMGGLGGGFVAWGSVDGISAYSWGTEVCNYGDAIHPFVAESNNHPVIATNMYRVADGMFRQIGLGWVKHTFAALPGTSCCPCVDPGAFDILGVGCSDPYSAMTNGNQEGFGGIAGLGPRSDINPVTGAFDFPYTFQGLSGDAVYKRLQVSNEDLDPALNPNAQYFAETHFIGPLDAQAGNGSNNAAYREVLVDGPVGDTFQLTFAASATVAGEPAIMAWQAVDPDVSIDIVDVPDDGRFILGSRCHDSGDGTWSYAYALYNMNSARNAQALTVPLPSNATAMNAAFHGVQYHSGEPFSSDDWLIVVDRGAVAWSTLTHAEDVNANALRWGTAYTFSFETTVAPTQGEVLVDLFAPAPEGTGSPDAIVLAGCVPLMDASPEDLDGDGVVGPADLALLLGAWGQCRDRKDCFADLDEDGLVGAADLALLLGSWG